MHPKLRQRQLDIILEWMGDLGTMRVQVIYEMGQAGASEEELMALNNALFSLQMPFEVDGHAPLSFAEWVTRLDAAERDYREAAVKYDIPLEDSDAAA
jgi:hypothetical protein